MGHAVPEALFGELSQEITFYFVLDKNILKGVA